MTIQEMFDLTGKVAVIIGGARDFGFNMADVLAEAGCDLVLTSRTLASAEQTAAKLKAKHKRDTLPLALDVTRHPQIAEVADRAAAWKGHIDILICRDSLSRRGLAHVVVNLGEALACVVDLGVTVPGLVD